MVAGVLNKLKNGLARTRDGLKGLSGLSWTKRPDADQLEELEELLLGSDIGVNATMAIVDAASDGGGMEEIIRSELLNRLDEATIKVADDGPTVIVLVGVNGTGKTTTAARIAAKVRSEGKKVVMAAADTFRAAAADQLAIWADRLGCELVRGKEGSDPAAVAFDAAQAAVARNADYLIVDTAGRLHTKQNLMNELSKVVRVLGKAINGAPHNVLLVVDATTGQNALRQARIFTDAVGVTSLVLTKLDGTARGGVIVAIADELGLPVAYVGVGEQADDLVSFSADVFVDALLERG